VLFVQHDDLIGDLLRHRPGEGIDIGRQRLAGAAYRTAENGRGDDVSGHRADADHLGHAGLAAAFCPCGHRFQKLRPAAERLIDLHARLDRASPQSEPDDDPSGPVSLVDRQQLSFDLEGAHTRLDDVHRADRRQALFPKLFDQLGRQRVRDRVADLLLLRGPRCAVDQLAHVGDEPVLQLHLVRRGREVEHDQLVRFGHRPGLPVHALVGDLRR